MNTTRPLLIFPRPEPVEPPKGHGGSNPPPKPKEFSERIDRINNLFEQAINYIQYLPGDPDHVLVIETVGKFQDFHKAAGSIDGLEWLAEFDVDDVDLDEMYDHGSTDYEKGKKQGGRWYLSSSNVQALKDLLRRYNQWQKDGTIEHSFGAWKDFFIYITDLRLWNEKDRLESTGIIEQWKEIVDLKAGTSSECNFEIELHYHKNKDNSSEVINHIKQLKGKVHKLYRKEGIAFHAIKVSLPVAAIESVLSAHKGESNYPKWIQLSSIKYCRPIGQQLLDNINPERSEHFDINEPHIAPPIVALLDGAPLANHELIKDFILIDDPDDFYDQYEDNQHKHGTAMASLICHNDLSDPNRRSIERKIYVRPIMYPDDTPSPKEKVPYTEFIEDLIERSVVRLMDGEEPACPSIKIINLSIGIIDQQFIREISPLARLLDWLSWKYKILFIVSAGNYLSDPIHVPNRYNATDHFIKKIQDTYLNRKLLSPAESMNSLSVGAIQHDYSSSKKDGLYDPYKEQRLPAEYSRNGPGFRSQIKPDILLPGGRQLYRIEDDQWTPLDEKDIGQKTASVGPSAEAIAYTTHTVGTSNATAIASHAAAHLYEVIISLDQDLDPIPDKYHALVIKSLLVHGASWGGMEDPYFILINQQNSRKIKRVYANHLGYGEADFERVMSCTERRVTMIGFGELPQKKRHRFLLPIAEFFNGLHLRLIVTLAWFTPINPFRYGYRQAKLFFEVSGSNTQERQEADWQQVKKGTLQHEIFNLYRFKDRLQHEIFYLNRFSGNEIELSVQCNADAIENLEEHIPYTISVTLEAAQETKADLYNVIKQSIREIGIYHG